MNEFLIPITLFISIAVILALWLNTRHNERRMMIEKGLDTEDIKALFHKVSHPYRTVKWAFILMFGGAGLLIGVYISDVMRNDGYAFAVVFIMTGIGLLVYHKLYGSKLIDDDK